MKQLLLTLTLMIGLAGGRASAASWQYTYDGSVPPTSAGWTLSGTEGPNSGVSGGSFITDSASPGSGANYTMAWNANPATGWTVNFDITRLDTSSDYGSFLYIGDGTNQVQWDFYSNAYYRYSTDAGNNYYALDNTTAHDFQISVLGSAVNVYLDGNDTPIASFTAASAIGGPDELLFGQVSSPPGAETAIDSISYTTAGAFTPSEMAIPEPGVGMYIGLALLVLVVTRLRKLAA